MFQGEQFVFKHFKNKHEEDLNKEKKDVKNNNYSLKIPFFFSK